MLSAARLQVIGSALPSDGWAPTLARLEGLCSVPPVKRGHGLINGIDTLVVVNLSTTTLKLMSAPAAMRQFNPWTRAPYHAGKAGDAYVIHGAPPHLDWQQRLSEIIPAAQASCTDVECLVFIVPDPPMVELRGLVQGTCLSHQADETKDEDDPVHHPREVFVVIGDSESVGDEKAFERLQVVCTHLGLQPDDLTTSFWTGRDGVLSLCGTLSNHAEIRGRERTPVVVAPRPSRTPLRCEHVGIVLDYLFGAVRKPMTTNLQITVTVPDDVFCGPHTPEGGASGTFWPTEKWMQANFVSSNCSNPSLGCGSGTMTLTVHDTNKPFSILMWMRARASSSDARCAPVWSPYDSTTFDLLGNDAWPSPSSASTATAIHKIAPGLRDDACRKVALSDASPDALLARLKEELAFDDSIIPGFRALQNKRLEMLACDNDTALKEFRTVLGKRRTPEEVEGGLPLAIGAPIGGHPLPPLMRTHSIAQR